MWRAALGVAVLLSACASAPPAGARESIVVPGLRRGGPGVELTLRRPDGTFVELGDLRGRPVLVFFFATFDAMSQAVLHPLRQIADEAPELQIVGIAAQEGARLLVDAYEHALSPPFVVTYDPEERVLGEQSPLGPIQAVPSFVVLDRRGVAVGRHVGAIDADGLRALVAGAR
jgi:peroxiredoxin